MELYNIVMFLDHATARGDLPGQGTNLCGSAGRGFECENLHRVTLYITLFLMILVFDISLKFITRVSFLVPSVTIFIHLLSPTFPHESLDYPGHCTA